MLRHLLLMASLTPSTNQNRQLIARVTMTIREDDEMFVAASALIGGQWSESDVATFPTGSDVRYLTSVSSSLQPEAPALDVSCPPLSLLAQILTILADCHHQPGSLGSDGAGR